MTSISANTVGTDLTNLSETMRGRVQRPRSDDISPKTKSVAREVGYAIHGGHIEDWHLLTLALCHLEDEERAALAWAVLRSLTFEQVELVVGTIFPEVARSPLPPVFDIAEEAAFWADWATSDELAAYCLACFNRLSPARRGEFLDFVQGREAA